MKNLKNKIGLLRTAVLCLAVAAIAACDADDFTRSAGKIPGEGELSAVGGVLRREKTPDQVSMLKIDEGQPTVDNVFYQLTQPAPAAVTVTVDVDQTLVDEYNKDKEEAAKLTLFPLEKVSFDSGKTLTVAKGEKLSASLPVTFSREGVEKGMYLLPLRASVGDKAVVPSENEQKIFYRVFVGQHIEEGQLDAYPFKVVGYVNTEEMSPLMGNEFYVTVFDILNETEGAKTWLDIEILRTASLKLNASNGRAELELGSDLQYVLSNRDKYILPLQKKERKTLFCITGGNTGLGFCNLTADQITDFVYQIKYIVNTYQLDGVNFFDIEASYGKDGMPEIDPASYPRLIRATKEALGADKLVTVACDAESTELLATAQDGIEAGAYIDYAWSGIFDEVVDAYAEGSKLKPIAGLDNNKYGSITFKTNNTQKRGELRNTLIPESRTLYREHPESASIFAFWDMPTSSAGYEKGIVDTFEILTDALTDENIEYDGIFYLMEMTEDFRGYGKFTKDW